MGTFSTQCRRLRELYLSSNEENNDIKIKFLSKLFSLTFFMNIDSLLMHMPFTIFIGDINSDENTLIQCLVEVINDLNYKNCIVDSFIPANMVTVTVA